MSKKYNIEFFQSLGSDDSGGSDLSSAYKKGATVKNLISSSGSGSTGSSGKSGASAAPANSAPEVATVSESAPQGIQMGNIWQFLGIDTLSLKKKQCVYNCGMDLMGCMERCANPDCRQQQSLTHEQCRYGCMRKGISCSTNCISEIEPLPEPDPMFNSNNMNTPALTTSTSLLTQPVQITTSALVEQKEDSLEELCKTHYDVLPNEVQGVYADLDDYAPFDMRVWPKNDKFGWTISELNRLKRNGYTSPDTIEVNMNHGLYPIKNGGKPVLEFKYATD